MTQLQWETVIPALVLFLTSLAGYLQARQATIIAHNAVNKVAEVKMSVDGRMGELLSLAKESSHAAGVLDGRLLNLEKKNGGMVTPPIEI